MIQILLVEDHSLVIQGISTMLEKNEEIECTGIFKNGKDILTKLKSYQPDVILMDINLPDYNGIELCKEVKEKYPSVKVVALSINNQPGIIKKMIDSGASGYVLKDAEQHEIIEAIKTVIKRKQYFSQSAVTLLKQPENNGLPALTRRERDVLERIAEGLTNQQIAQQLFIDVSTVSSHRKNLLAKYNVQNTAALIKLAITEKLI
ncbi:MAG TPA: response regulator transcription factor [Chitinophagales bacterium]|nr:response regulator transcription factor [Chitinophagales bacterium]